MPRKKKEKPVGEFRNMELMPGKDNLWQFECKLKDGSWQLFTNLGAETPSARNAFAKATADRWIKE